MYNHNIYTVIMVRCSNVITRIGNKENDIKIFPVVVLWATLGSPSQREGQQTPITIRC
jgi:hypothetical protein